MKTYTVRVAREGKWWMVRVPEIDGLTQARRFAESGEMARSLIAITLDVEPDSFALHTEIEAIEDIHVTEAIDHIHDELEKAEQLQTAARAETRTLATQLAERGVTVRDIGAMLNVSFQRAQQFIESARIADRKVSR